MSDNQISRRDLLVIQCLIFAAQEQIALTTKNKSDLDLARISRSAPHYAKGYGIKLTPGEAEYLWNKLANALKVEG